MKSDKPFYKRIFVSFVNEWDQLINFRTYNWTTWNWCLVKFEYENDVILGAYELTIVLAGIGVRIRYAKPIKTKEMLEIEESIRQIDAGTAKTTPWEEIHAPFMVGRCPRCCFKIDGLEEKDEDNKEDK